MQFNGDILRLVRYSTTFLHVEGEERCATEQEIDPVDPWAWIAGIGFLSLTLP